MKKKKIDFELFEKILTKSQQYAKVSKENTRIAEQWVTIAEDDIEIAKLLYDKKHFAGSTYHLQQGFEKLIKGYYIFTGRMSPEQAHGHKFVLDKLRKELVEEDIHDVIRLSSSMNETEVNLKGSEDSLNIMQSSEDKFRNLTDEDIEYVFSILNKIEQKMKSKETLDLLEERKNERKFFSFLKHAILRITGFRVRDSQVKEAIEEKKIIDYIEGLLIGIKLNYMGIITFLHSNTSRYPYDKSSNLNFFNYNKDFSLVKYSPKIINTFDNINSNMKYWINEQSKNSLNQLNAQAKEVK
jgi:HEPN domain-containing protein